MSDLNDRLLVWMQVVILIILLLFALYGDWMPWKPWSSPSVEDTKPVKGNDEKGPLFVLVHGFASKREYWNEIQEALLPYGDVLLIHYNNRILSNVDPMELARLIDAHVQKSAAQMSDRKIVVVAHSAGALISRRAMLVGQQRGGQKNWTDQVSRLVLLAGTNRGWDLTSQRPLDMQVTHRWMMQAGAWFARMTGLGSFVMQFEAGSKYVADLRIDWMNFIRGPKGSQIEVVQMLGDIDNIVSEEDNADLRALTSQNSKFAHVRVRGTDHGQIVNVAATSELEKYRREKLIMAATEQFSHIISEELPFSVDNTVTTIVFVLHGIRDLGEWSTDFESELQKKKGAAVRIVSPRYGYLGMGPFLFRGVREKYVKWFMDEYTETLARYPKVQPNDIHFFGHSNGTYLLAKALDSYCALKVGNVVFGGSVVPRDYGWDTHLASGQVLKVRNYVGTHDWVVALFPRFFEMPGVRLLNNELGSAGSRGFSTQNVENVEYARGAHGAYMTRIPEIVDFLVGTSTTSPKLEKRGAFGQLLGLGISVWLTWTILATAVIYVGVRVVGSTPSPNWWLLFAYVLLVVNTLRML